MGLIRIALIFGIGYALGRPDTRQKITEAGRQLAERPEVGQLKERGRDTLTTKLKAARPATGPKDAPDPDSSEFLDEQNPVEKVSPETTADAPARAAGAISTDPSPSEGKRSGT
jgi:hypothetical protein